MILKFKYNLYSNKIIQFFFSVSGTYTLIGNRLEKSLRLDYKTVQEQNVHPLEQKAKTPTGNLKRN